MLAALFGNVYWTLLAVVVSVWVWFRYFRNPHARKLLEKLSGPPGLPIIGNVLDVHAPDFENTETFVRLLRKYSRDGIMKLHLAHRPVVFIHSARGSEAILGSTTELTKSSDYDFIVPWLGTGLLISSGTKWRTRRKLLTPAFHFRILEDFMDVYNEQSEILVERLTEQGDTTFDLCPFLSHCTLDIICETAMGQNVNAQRARENPYLWAVNEIAAIIHRRNLHPWLWYDWIFALTKTGKTHNKCLGILHSFTEKVIRERRQELKTRGPRTEVKEDDILMGKKPRLAFLDLILQASDDGRVLNDDDIREEVDTIMFGGHDTTSSALTSALWLLGTHPEIQLKIQEELDTVLGDTKRQITSEDLKSFKYLESCIKESLRLFPPAPGIARQLAEDLNIDGQIIPAGVDVVVSFFMLHRSPDQYPNPETYDPDRFLPENSVGRSPYAFVPFSAGPRNCIGQKFALLELKVVLAHIFRSFTVEAMEKVKPADLKIFTQIIIRPQHGLQVKLHPRVKKD